MNSILRWGLLSTARINAKVIPAIQQAGRSRLAAVASRDLDRARRYAQEFDIPHAFGSYEAMLSSDTIDAVYISLPNDQHAEWSIRALRAGKHVLCEKPFALNLSDAQEMFSTAREFGRVIAEAFMYFHHPQTILVLDLLRQGRIGEPRMVHGAFHFSLAKLQDIRANPLMGGGSIWDVGVYPISYAQQVFASAPEEVMGWSRVGPTGVDMSFTGMMRYPENRMAQFSSSFESPLHMQIDIFGSAGRLHITRPYAGMEDGIVELYASDGSVERILSPQKHLYLGQIEDMERAALDGEPQRITAPQTISHVRTVCALLQSTAENRPVPCSWGIA